MPKIKFRHILKSEIQKEKKSRGRPRLKPIDEEPIIEEIKPTIKVSKPENPPILKYRLKDTESSIPKEDIQESISQEIPQDKRPVGRPRTRPRDENGSLIMPKQENKFAFVNKSKFSNNEKYVENFLEKWKNCRERHQGQKEIEDSVFNGNYQYIFVRAGRKLAKTATAIEIAWYLSNIAPNRIGYLGYPSIAQGIEVIWEEKRLQQCDLKTTSMFDEFVEKIDNSRHTVHFKNGSLVKLVGTWTEARGRGTQPDFIIFDEFQDCNPEYIDAFDANLAAKPHSQCLMMGTPPKKRNHYESWWERVSNHRKGKTFHYTSYQNTMLSHLSEWLDDKKDELIKSGQEDIWLREYMADFCYSSSDRILPDAKFLEKDEMDRFISHFHYSERVPIVAVSVHQRQLCCILGILIPKKMIIMRDKLIISQIWDKSYSDVYPSLQVKVKELQDLCKNKVRNLCWDEKEAFTDVVKGFSKCRKDIKWQDRGIPLLREMMVKEKIKISREVADFGLECQNLLAEDTPKIIEKDYPHICAMAMMVNEYFSPEKITIVRDQPFDKYQAFRDMGIPVPKRRTKRMLFR